MTISFPYIVSLSVSDIIYPDLEEEIQIPIISELPSAQPVIDRRIKPDTEVKFNRFVSDPSLEPSDRKNLHPLSTKDTNAEFVIEPKKTPNVDRNLKNNAIMKYLEEEEKLVELSLKMTQDRLHQEKEWNQVRIQKESAIDNEMKAHLQQREEELIHLLKKMETDNKEQVKKKKIKDYGLWRQYLIRLINQLCIVLGTGN